MPQRDVYDCCPPIFRQRMRLILPDGTVRTIGTGPVPVDRILLAEGINPLEVMVTRGGTLVTGDAIVENGDEIRLIRIAHGG